MSSGQYCSDSSTVAKAIVLKISVNLVKVWEREINIWDLSDRYHQECLLGQTHLIVSNGCCLSIWCTCRKGKKKDEEEKEERHSILPKGNLRSLASLS